MNIDNKSIKIDLRPSFSHGEMILRIDIFKKYLSSINIDISDVKGLSPAAVYSYRAKGNVPLGASLEEWGSRYGLSLDWLLWGEGEMLRETPAQAESNCRAPVMRCTAPKTPAEYAQGPRIVEVGLHGVAEAGRVGLEIFARAPKRVIPILECFYRPGLHAFEVDGSSMEPTIRRGSYIGVIPLDGDLINGEMYLIKRPHFGMLVKRVFMGVDKLILKSDNVDHPPLELPYEGYEVDTVILGRVIWIWQNA